MMASVASRGVARSRSALAASSGMRRLSSQPSESPPRESDEVVAARMVAAKKARIITVVPSHVREVPDIPSLYSGDMSEIGLLADQPESQRVRQVIIKQNCASAMSSGKRKIHRWHINWGAPKLGLNPLMGWSGGNDPMGTLDIAFDTPEAAVRFANKMGWSYELKDPIVYDNESRYGTSSYSHNFLPRDVEHELETKKTRTKLFENPKAGVSNYFRPLTWTGDRPVDQHGPTPK